MDKESPKQMQSVQNASTAVAGRERRLEIVPLFRAHYTPIDHLDRKVPQNRLVYAPESKLE